MKAFLHKWSHLIRRRPCAPSIGKCLGRGPRAAVVPIVTQESSGNSSNWRSCSHSYLRKGAYARPKEARRLAWCWWRLLVPTASPPPQTTPALSSHSGHERQATTRGGWVRWRSAEGERLRIVILALATKSCGTRIRASDTCRAREDLVVCVRVYVCVGGGTGGYTGEVCIGKGMCMPINYNYGST